MSDTLRDIPAVRGLADRQAREVWAANVGYFRAAGWDIVADPDEAPEGFGLTVSAQLDLLCDITRPESAACIMQAVADRVGYPRHCGLCLVRNGAHGWALFNGLNPGVQFVGNLRGWPKNPAPVLVPALIGITDPAAALALIATHVLSERA